MLNYYYAEMGTGQKSGSLLAEQGAKRRWLTGKSQPNACDKLFSVWRASGKLQTRWRIWNVFGWR